MSFRNKEEWEQFKTENNFSLADIDILQRMSKSQTFSVSAFVIILLAVLYGSISIIAVVGNILVILVVAIRRNMQTVTNIFLANLALADVILGLFAIPFQFQSAVLQRWVVADFMCKVAPFVKNLSIDVSVLSLTLIAIDRYVAVRYPLRAGFRKTAAAIILSVIWILSICASIPEAIYFRIGSAFLIRDMKERQFCNVVWPSWTFFERYSVMLALFQYIVPLSIITAAYILVILTIWRSLPAESNRFERRDSTRTANRKKVIKMLIIVVSLFAICWLPLQIYNILVPFYTDTITSFKYINVIWLCCNWLAMSNSCYNPFIYGLLNVKFKREFKKFVSSCRSRKRRGTQLKEHQCRGVKTDLTVQNQNLINVRNERPNIQTKHTSPDMRMIRLHLL